MFPPPRPPPQGLKPAKVKDTNTGKFVNDYWETSKKMLSDMGFLDSLKTYDKVGVLTGCLCLCASTMCNCACYPRSHAVSAGCFSFVLL